MRAPDATFTMPGRITAPATWTTRSALVAVAAGAGAACARGSLISGGGAARRMRRNPMHAATTTAPAAIAKTAGAARAAFRTSCTRSRHVGGGVGRRSSGTRTPRELIHRGSGGVRLERGTQKRNPLVGQLVRAVH